MSESQPATGELSKNAQKKLAKAEEVARKKAEMETGKNSTSSSSSAKGGVVEEILDPTQYYENRLKAIANMEVRRSLDGLRQCSVSLCVYLTTYVCVTGKWKDGIPS